MRLMALTFLMTAALGASALAMEADNPSMVEEEGAATEITHIQRTADFINADGETVGSAILTQSKTGVLIHVKLEDIPAGEHGFHIHEKGECALMKARDGVAKPFTTAGGHLNPDGHGHGFMFDGGPHPGDMPNLYVKDDETVEADIFNTMISLEEHAGKTHLLDEDGSAIIVHAGNDDYHTQDTGGAGDRIACAEIK